MNLDKILLKLKNHTKEITEPNSSQRNFYVLGIMNGIMGMYVQLSDEGIFSNDDIADCLEKLGDFHDGL